MASRSSSSGCSRARCSSPTPPYRSRAGGSSTGSVRGPSGCWASSSSPRRARPPCSPSLGLTARLLGGIGTAFVFVGGSDYIRAAGGSALAQGVYGGSSLAAGGLALALVPQVEDAVGWRAPFVTSLAVAAAGLLLLLAAPDAPRRAPHAVDGSVFRDRRLLPFAWLHAASFGLVRGRRE